jgi:hypothetical protein
MKKRKQKLTLTPRDRIKCFLEAYYPDDVDKILLADGLDNAFKGVINRDGKPVAVYGKRTCLFELAKTNNWSIDDAEEYFSFNVEGAYVGDRTPLFMEEL